MSEPTIKYLPFGELLEGGYLQEANRRFFHPLGLALEVVVDDNGNVTGLGGVWDYRDSPDGIVFRILDDAFETFQKKADKVQTELDEKWRNRKERLGYAIQPIIPESE